jgi:XRE family aerobic/anaerobic benzoate catabolism transcriptional regulator
MARDDGGRAGAVLARNIGHTVERARFEEGWSRRQLAEESGLSERFIADVERGSANPSLKSLAALAAALDTTMAGLFGEDALPPRLVSALGRLPREELERLADELEGGDGRRLPALRVALVGLRGAGKTTVGRLLAKRLDCAFVELDRAIEEAAQLSLAQVFELHGEAYYRRLEREVLEAVLARESRAVIATGGGLPSHAPTYALLREACRTVWLKAKPEEYLARVLKQGDRRPVEKRPHALAELKALLAAREPAYRQAELSITTSGLEPDAVVRRVAGWLERSRKRPAAERSGRAAAGR